MNDLLDFIAPEMLIIIVVLYVLGMGLKNTTLLKDKYIPLALGVLAIFLCAAKLLIGSVPLTGNDWVAFLFESITQGVLCAGIAVYGNQIVKQLGKDE